MASVELARTVGPGNYVLFRGDVLRIEEVQATTVIALDVGKDSIRAVLLSVFMAESRPCTRTGETVMVEQNLQWDLATDEDQRAALRNASELMYVITGVKSTDPEELRRAQPCSGKTKRAAELAEHRGVSIRKIWRDLKALRAAGGSSGLTRPIAQRQRRSSIDPRWSDKLAEIVSRNTNESKWDIKLVLEDVSTELEEQHGPGAVRIPGKSTAYNYIKRNYEGTNAFEGSTKGRRSIAERPPISLGQLKPTRAGQFVIMDTHVLDVFAMDSITGGWVQCQLTVAQDLYTRSILGLSVTPVSTKAVDVATVLFEVCHPRPIRGKSNSSTTWNYHGVPENLVFTERSNHWGMPLVAAESLIVDNGRAFISTHVLEVCHRKGITVMPAHPYKPTDKPTVERFFRTLRSDCIMRLPGYKGPDIDSRGKNPQDDAYHYTDEIEDLVRHWITGHYHKHDHGGLVEAADPNQKQSPNRMYELSVEVHGLPRIATHPYAFVEFLPIAWRKLMHYGFQVKKGRRYRDDTFLASLTGRESPYTGPHAGLWPVRYNPDDITRVYVQDPRDLQFHELEWEHAHKFDGPCSEDVYDVLRKWSQQTGTPIENSRGIIAEWTKNNGLTRRDRNAMIRSAHFADKREHGKADSTLAPAVDSDLLPPAEVPKSEDLVEDSAWDDKDDDSDARDYAEKHTDAVVRAQPDSDGESNDGSDVGAPAPARAPREPSQAHVVPHEPTAGDERGDDNYVPEVLEVR